MKKAAEIMNRNFYAIAPDSAIATVLHEMAERGLGSVPVLDLERRPLGMATLAEIERCHHWEELTKGLMCPALTVHQETPADIAARTLGLHRASSLLLVDDQGAAVGSLTALDLLRYVLGLNGVRAETVRRSDESWDRADYLEVGAVHRAPEAPGIILLSPGLGKDARHIVWAEAADNMRERLDEMLRTPQDDLQLESLLDVFPRTLRFQCVTVFDDQQRKQMAESLARAEPEERAAASTDAPASLVLPTARRADVV